MAFVQSGTQRIQVIVTRDDGGGLVAGADKGNKEKTTEEITHDGTSGHSSNRRKKRILLTNLTHIVAVGRQVSNMAFNFYGVEQAGIKAGDSVLSDNISRTFEQVADPLNVATSIVMGGVYGAWGGPIGAVVGATLGGLSSGASVFFKYARRERDYSIKIFKENNAIEYKRARANINLTTGRLR